MFASHVPRRSRRTAIDREYAGYGLLFRKNVTKSGQRGALICRKQEGVYKERDYHTVFGRLLMEVGLSSVFRDLRTSLAGFA